MTINDSFISIKGLQIYAYHGVLPIERSVGNTFEIDADLHYDASTAMDSDNITTAINYASVVAEITRVMSIPEQLLEHVANQIVTRLCYVFPEITSGKLTVKKLNPPIDQQMSSVGFTIAWSN
jgi:dihydroneopterin aldolase